MIGTWTGEADTTNAPETTKTGGPKKSNSKLGRRRMLLQLEKENAQMDGEGVF